MIMSKLYFVMSCFTAGMLGIYGVEYINERPRVEVSCEDPKIGKFSGELHPRNVIETPLGWVIIRRVNGLDKVEVYETCSRYWP